MLDNLFNSILVVSFLVISAVGAVSSPVDHAASASETLVQLERVIVVGHSVKATNKA